MSALAAVYVDALDAVRAWLNGRLDLVGPGKPIAQGAYLEPVRSPGSGAYVLLLRVGGTADVLAETPLDRARISATIYGGTLTAASLAAVAYANAIAAINGAPVAMGASAVCLVVEQIAGPLQIDDQDTSRERYRFQVDADFLLTPAA